jgi:hypothetical protein
VAAKRGTSVLLVDRLHLIHFSDAFADQDPPPPRVLASRRICGGDSTLG